MPAHLRFCKHPYCGTGIGTTGIHKERGSPGSGQLPLEEKKKKTHFKQLSMYSRTNEDILLFKNNKVEKKKTLKIIESVFNVFFLLFKA